MKRLYVIDVYEVEVSRVIDVESHIPWHHHLL